MAYYYCYTGLNTAVIITEYHVQACNKYTPCPQQRSAAVGWPGRFCPDSHIRSYALIITCSCSLSALPQRMYGLLILTFCP
jgi:hypothetical protein